MIGRFSVRPVRISEANGASVDLKARTARVLIITEGMGNLKDKNFYTADAIRSAARVFEGKRFFIDHPSRSEEDDRPERSVRDLAGYFYGTQLGSVKDPETGEPLQACFANLRFAESEPGNLAMGQVVAALEYQRRFPDSKDVYCGISINGGGLSHPGQIKGVDVNMVTEIQEAFSADIVTMPARGGKFLAMVQEAVRRAEGPERSWEMTDQEKKELKRLRAKESREKAVAKFKEAAPKLVSLAVRAVAEAKAKVDGKGLKEAQMDEAKMRMGKLGERLKNLSAALAAPQADAKTIASDIKVDLDELIKAAGIDAGAEAGYEDEVAKMMAGAGAQAGGAAEGDADADEAARREGAEGGGDDDLGMGDEDLDDDDLDGAGEHDDLGGEVPPGREPVDPKAAPARDEGAAQKMQFKCAKCAEDNVVLPPKGMRLVAAEAMSEAKEAVKGFKDLVKRLRETLTKKEGRMKDQNAKLSETAKRIDELEKENVELKAENMATKRLSEAQKFLKENEIPAGIMGAEDLIVYEPHQWASQVRMARRAMRLHESDAYGGERGAEPRQLTEAQVKETADKAIAAFDSEYKK